MKEISSNTMTVEFIAEDEITPENLLALINAAYIEAEFDEDGDLMIKDEYRVFLSIDDRNKVLWYRIYFHEEDSVSHADLAVAAAKINAKVIFANIQITENNEIFVDTFLVYRKGLPKHTIIYTLRELESVTNTLTNDLRECLDEVRNA